MIQILQAGFEGCGENVSKPCSETFQKPRGIDLVLPI